MLVILSRHWRTPANSLVKTLTSTTHNARGLAKTPAYWPRRFADSFNQTWSRARVSQLFDLALLAPDIQESVLDLEAVDGVEPMAERSLRAVARAGTWEEQRTMWARIRVDQTLLEPAAERRCA